MDFQKGGILEKGGGGMNAFTNYVNSQKIYRWTKRPETILENRKKTTILKVINKSIIYKLLRKERKTIERRLMGRYTITTGETFQ